MTSGEFWFFERHLDYAGLMLRIKRHLTSRKTEFQTIDVFDTDEYGRVLTLDNLIMLTERDEFAYHEMLVHVPMLIHLEPRKVLVVGGGDGGVLREVIKHQTVKRAVQVEIDRGVVEVCCQFFPWAQETFNHPKVELVIDDALDYVSNHQNEFDVVIVDSTDPVGPAVQLFEAPFYKDIHQSLTQDGVFSCQIDAPFYNMQRIRRVVNSLRGIFHQADMYVAFVPGYPSGVWGLGFASKSKKNVSQPDKVRYDTIKDSLKYYNLEVHRGSFLLPEYMRRVIHKTE